MSAELTRPHFSTKVYKCYLHYLRTNHPEVDLEALSREAGLPLRHIEDENNWVSVVFDERFTRGAIRESRDNRVPFEAGRQNATPAVLGHLVHLMVRFSLSLDLVYRTLPRFTSFFTQVTELKLVDQRDGIAIYHFGPKDLDKLNADEKVALRRNYGNVLQNTLGHYTGLPTVKSKLPALVKFQELEGKEQEDFPIYEIEINYGVSEHPLRKLAEKSIPLTSAMIGLTATITALLLRGPFQEAALLGSLTALSYLAIRGYLAQRGMGKNLETLARDYELLDRRYTGVQRTKERLARLARRNRRYRHLFDELNVGIAVVSGPDFENPKLALSNFNYQTLGTELTENLLVSNSLQLRQVHTESASREIRDIEVNDSGASRYYTLRLFPIGKNDVATLVDETTERVMADRAIARERARSIQASKLAALGEMAAGISHELNNPLSVVTLLCDQALDCLGRAQPEKVPQILDKANRHLERMAKIIQSVKKFSRDSSTVQTKTLKVREIVEQAAELVENRLERVAAELSIEIDDHISVEANEIDLSQVLVNLIANSCDAVAGLDLRNIKVSSKLEMEHVIIDVTDSGPGVPEETGDQVLNPFFTTKEVGKGTGLGLSLSATIINKHGGSLELLPSLPCTFRIKIPQKIAIKPSEISSIKE